MPLRVDLLGIDCNWFRIVFQDFSLVPPLFDLWVFGVFLFRFFVAGISILEVSITVAKSSTEISTPIFLSFDNFIRIFLEGCSSVSSSAIPPGLMAIILAGVALKRGH